MDDRIELSGWDQIAGHLGISRRAAQEHRRLRGLPVHQLPGQRGRVWAFADELDSWKRNGTLPAAVGLPAIQIVETRPIDQRSGVSVQDTQDPSGFKTPSIARWLSQRWKVFAIVSIILVGLISLAIGFGWKGQEVSRPEVLGKSIQILDQADRPMGHEFTLPGKPLKLEVDEDHPRRYVTADLDGDGRKEVLFLFHNLDRPADSDTVYCLRPDGSLRWNQRIGRDLSTIKTKDAESRILPANYRPLWIHRLKRPTPQGGVVIVGGHNDGSSLFAVVLLDRNGKTVGEYYHIGWLWGVDAWDLDGDGYDEIILGGVNDGYGNIPNSKYHMTVVVLDSRNFGGQGPTPPEDNRHLAGLKTGTEKAVLLLPRFAPEIPDHFCAIETVQYNQGYIIVRASLLGGHGEAVTYRFDSQLNLNNIMPSAAVESVMKTDLSQRATQAERARFYMKVLGDVHTLANNLSAHSRR